MSRNKHARTSRNLATEVNSLSFRYSKALILVATVGLLALGYAQSNRKYSYALVTNDGNTFENWDGSSDQFPKGGPDRLYVKKDGQRYVITDPSTIANVKAAFGPVMKIAAKQTALGDKQSKLGDSQSKIGDQESKLGDEMSKIGDQMGDAAQSGDDAKQKDLQAKMDALQEKMNALEKQMDEPNAKQEALSKQQDALGKEQDKASAIAEKKVDAIIDQAFAHGLAKPG